MDLLCPPVGKDQGDLPDSGAIPEIAKNIGSKLASAATLIVSDESETGIP